MSSFKWKVFLTTKLTIHSKTANCPCCVCLLHQLWGSGPSAYVDSTGKCTNPRLVSLNTTTTIGSIKWSWSEQGRVCDVCPLARLAVSVDSAWRWCEQGLVLQANHIQEVCQANENMGKVCEEKIVVKMENALRNREEQLKALQERLLEHVSCQWPWWLCGWLGVCLHASQ